MTDELDIVFPFNCNYSIWLELFHFNWSEQCLFFLPHYIKAFWINNFVVYVASLECLTCHTHGMSVLNRAKYLDGRRHQKTRALLAETASTHTPVVYALVLLPVMGKGYFGPWEASRGADEIQGLASPLPQVFSWGVETASRAYEGANKCQPPC